MSTAPRNVHQGTLALMVLRILDTDANHGYGIAKQIEATSGQVLTLNYGTLYPALLKLEQQGFIRAEWRTSEHNRRAKYYSITRAGRGHLAKKTAEWRETNRLLDLFLAPEAQ